MSVSIIFISGCSIKNTPVAFTPEDYASFSKLQKDVFNEQSFYEHIDGVLGLENYTFFDFMGETSPYTQITLSCIHKGVLNLNQNKNSIYRVVKTPELDQCIKEIGEQPVMTDVLLTHNLGWVINNASQTPEVKTAIEDAKKDNILTVIEFLKIGSLSNDVVANSIVQSDNTPKVNSSVVDENLEKISQYIVDENIKKFVNTKQN